MVILRNIPKGYKAIGGIALSPNEVSALQNMADDMNIGDAAEVSLQTRRRLEWVMSKLKTELNIKTNHGLIVHLIRAKIIK